MKLLRVILLPTILAGAGCLTLPTAKDEPPPKSQPKSEAARSELPISSVNPDEITESNAREKAEALRKELSQQGHP
jgi:hypothetical protein